MNPVNSKPVAILVPCLVEVPGKRGYRWVAGYKITDPTTGHELQPYQRAKAARAWCAAQGWSVHVKDT